MLSPHLHLHKSIFLNNASPTQYNSCREGMLRLPGPLFVCLFFLGGCKNCFHHIFYILQDEHSYRAFVYLLDKRNRIINRCFCGTVVSRIANLQSLAIMFHIYHLSFFQNHL